MDKRLFLIVLDSFGVGELPDADKFGDVGSDTLHSCSTSKYFNVPAMKKLGLYNIDGVHIENGEKECNPTGSFCKLCEKSAGKDTTIGHWEIGGLISPTPFPTYPYGFPEYIIKEFEQKTGRKVLCNKPYSGTKVIEDYGKEHLETGSLIVYTSADSVFQIAAHEDTVAVDELYKYCETARQILTGKDAVARVIARPFVGEYPNFSRTANRHDFSIEPPKSTMLDLLKANGLDVISVGKIYDIFAGRGITRSTRTVSNSDGMKKTLEIQKEDFNGLCFVNLVDFDMLYGHRNDVDGYAKALSEFDGYLSEFVSNMRDNDVLMITADHGCDPATVSTDHSREYIPLLIYGKGIKQGVNLGTRPTYADISASVLDYFGIDNTLCGTSFLGEIYK